MEIIMNSNTHMTLGEKIRQIRLAKNISQEHLAKAANTSKTYISRIERGEAECSGEMLAAIKKFMGVENAPLYEHELEFYKEQLLVWHKLVKAQRLDECKIMQEKLAPILELPFEQDLSLMYTLLKIMQQCVELKATEASDAMSKIEPLPCDASHEVLYLYHSAKSMLCNDKGDYLNALRHSLKLLENESKIIKADASAFHIIGDNYVNAGKPFHAISYLERARAEYSGDRTNTIVNRTDKLLGTCYIYLGDLERAKDFCENALARAMPSNDAYDIRDALSRLSFIYLLMKDYDKCISLSEQTISLAQADSTPGYAAENKYMCVLAYSYMARCYLETKKEDKFHDVIKQGLSLAQPEEMLVIKLETLRQLSTLKDSSSQEYLENVALPFFINHINSDNLFVLYICEKLEAHYRKYNATRKANAIGRVTRDIYRNMINGDIGELENIGEVSL